MEMRPRNSAGSPATHAQADLPDALHSLDRAVEIANDTDFGIAAYISGQDEGALRALIPRLRAAQVIVNTAPADPMAPFGGYKKSGNGREWGDHGFHEYLEVKAVIGYPGAS